MKYLIFLLLFLVLQSCKEDTTVMQVLNKDVTNIDFVNAIDTTKYHRALYFFYYFNGGGVATGDINNDGLTDIYFTANSYGHNKLYLNKGGMKFEDITAKAGVQGIADWCSGVTMVDINGDGYLDIYVSSINGVIKLKGQNALYINNKNNTFTESSSQYGLNFSKYTIQTAFFDYDHDGDLDCYVLNLSQKPHENLKPASNRVDYDSLAGDMLLRNDVETLGKFTDVSKQAGIYQSKLGYGLGISIGDLNHDGWDDIYIGNDFHENDYCYINQGNGTFIESGADLFNHYSRFSMGNDIADFNNDGHPDIMSVDMLPPDEKKLKTYSGGESVEMYQYMILQNGYQHQFSKNCLQMNNGYGKSFSDVSIINNVYATDWSWSPLIVDIDNDGKKDIFVTAGIPKRTADLDFTNFINNISPTANLKQEYDKAIAMLPEGACHNFIFKNNGDDGFTDLSADLGLTHRAYHTGSAHADLDNDGDLDFVVNALNSPSFIYQNNHPKQNFISLTFKGEKANQNGLGCKVWCFSKLGMQYQQNLPIKGFQSSSQHNLIFGIGNTPNVDSILVVWPDQKYEVIRNVQVNTKTTASIQAAKGRFDHASFFKVRPKSIAASSPLFEYTHREDSYNDFNDQYLIPHMLSTQGPRIALGDLNNDKYEDVYVCGTTLAAGQLWFQTKNGTFQNATIPAIKNANFEQTNAKIFDANNDGHNDLLVVCGGNTSIANHHNLDVLFLNNGRGGFDIKNNFMPQITGNQSSMAVADLDNDNDLDLVIGSIHYYNISNDKSSLFVLLNDGKGEFSIAPSHLINTQGMAMITAVECTDIDKDGRHDVVVAGEWMPITLFMNKGSRFEKMELPGKGLWQSIFIDDVNNDGHKDILGGNWGNNSKIKADASHPISLYIYDVDQNGSTDHILTYTKEGKEYPLLGKEDLEKVIPSLKKKYLKFADFAGTEIDKIFDINQPKVQKFSVDNTSSAYFLNNGKGGFSRNDLSQKCQYTPINVIHKLNANGEYLAGGNFFGIRPSEGRYDAASLFTFNPLDGRCNTITTKGETRDIKKITIKNRDVILVAKNNAPIEFYEMK